MLSIVVDLLASANVLCDGSRTSIDLKSLNEIPLEYGCTRHNSADSVPTSNLVFLKEVAIRTTFSCWNNLLPLQLNYWHSMY